MRSRSLLVVIAMLSAGVCAAAEFTLVEDGQPQATVTLGDAPTDVEMLARQELVRYVELSTGATLPAEGDLPGEIQLAVSDGAALRIGLDVTTERVRITGSSPIALLNGVYRFLQDYLGCRWYVPGEIGEIVPEHSTVTIPVGTAATTPDWDIRTFFLRDDEAQWWALRNGINGWFNHDFIEALGTGVGDDLVYQQPGVSGFHAWARILPPEKYRPEHPEYYALVNDRRMEGGLHSGQICTTNEEALNIITEGAREYFEAHPDARWYSVAPNDGYGWCTCDDCMALQEQLGGVRYWRGGDHQILSDRQLAFGNEVARRLDMDDRELIVFAYVNHAPPPMNIHPNDGVTVWLCHYLPACYAHAITDPTCPDNAEFYGYVKGWARWSERMGYYAYTDKSMWQGLPRPVVRPMMEDLKMLHDHGWRRYVAQSSARGFGQNGPLYWMTAKLLWDVDADVEALLDEYFRTMYGPAAAEMRAYYEALEYAMLHPHVHFTSNPYDEGPKVFSREEIDVAREHLVAALAEADSTDVEARIRERLASLDRAIPILQHGWAMAEYAETGDVARLQEATEIARELAQRGGRLGDHFKRLVTGLELLVDRGLVLTAMSEPMELGGRKAWNADETGPGDNAAGWMEIKVPRADHTRPHILELTVWGESATFGPVISTEGGGIGTAQGGVWTPLELIEGELSGKAQWDTLKYRVEPEQFDPEIVGAEIGFGGADSQIWISDASFYPVGEQPAGE